MPFLGQCGGKLFSTSTALPRSTSKQFCEQLRFTKQRLHWTADSQPQS